MYIFCHSNADIAVVLHHILLYLLSSERMKTTFTSFSETMMTDDRNKFNILYIDFFLMLILVVLPIEDFFPFKFNEFIGM